MEKDDNKTGRIPWPHRERVRRAVSAALGAALAPAAAHALPAGGQVSAGQASIGTGPNSVHITQSSSRAVLDWSSFNVDSGEQVDFSQPSASSIALNRIHDTQASTINGQLNANGQVWLLNPNGVLFGSGSQVNVGGLLATTSNIGNSDFMAGNYNFTPGGNPAASVSNAGTITAADSGLVALVAPQVQNSGVINARLGKVALASGDSFTLDLYGDGLINLGVSDGVAKQLVANSGAIQADGGQVQLTAAAASNAVSGVINMSGVIQARTLGDLMGNVDLYAQGSNAVLNNDAALKGQKSGSSTVLVSGTIDASGYDAGQKGGTVQVLGDQVGLLSGSRIDASGDAGGGTVRVGGDFHGEGTTPTAWATVMQTGATIKADAVTTGNGGNVTLWADNYTNFAGNISARGGSLSGNGGFVETSGKEDLQAFGNVDASAPNGSAGTWLLDPADVTISTAANTNETGDPSFVPNGAASVINTTTIQNDLDAGTNVSVTTGGDAFAGNGDITVANSIAKSAGGDATLTLSAYRDITVNAPISSSSGKLNMLFQTDNHANGSGYIDIAAALTTNGGSITMGGGNGVISAGSGYAVGNAGQSSGVFINNVAVNAGGGNIIINGKGYNTTTDSNYGVYVAGAAAITGNGSITINGIGQGNSNSGSDYGVYINGISAITGNGGDLSITGVGGNSSGNENFGVYLNGGTISNTGGGDITMNATGGGSGNSAADYGLYMQGAITTVNGNITVNGMGGDSGGSGTINEGINLSNAGNIIKSTGNGSIFLTGTGGGNNGTGQQNYGLYVYQATVSVLGTGAITLVGTGSNSSGGINEGVNIGSAAVAAGGGNISIIGTGGNDSGSNNSGVAISGTPISTGGNGTITITGTGSGNSGSGSNDGVAIVGGSVLSAANGDLTIAGTDNSTGTGSGDDGVYLANIGTALETTGTGNISVSGIAGGNRNGGSQNDGILNFATIEALGSGNVSLTGIGGPGIGGFNYGVEIGSPITASGGNITITGTGGNSSGNTNYGISVQGNPISTIGAGTISLTGTGGGSGASGSDSGVIVWSGGTVSAVNGSITINTRGGSGTGGSNYGLYVKDAGSTVETTGSGNISVSARGGNGNYGLDIASANGLETTGAGTITADSTGSDIFLETTGSILSNAAGSAIILASGQDFLNDAGAASLSTPRGRWLIYSTSPFTDNFDGLRENFTLFGCADGGPCPTIPGSGNGFLFSEGMSSVIPASVTIASSTLASNTAPKEWQKPSNQVFGDSSTSTLAMYCKSVDGVPVCYAM